MPSLNKSEVVRWKNDQGDRTHILNHNLTSESIVVDIGGFTGLWAEKIIEKFNPYFYIIEPVPEFYNILVKKFSKNPKVTLLNVGVSDEDKTDTIFLNKDGSSIFNSSSQEQIQVSFLSTNSLLNIIDKKVIDLVQINIEGCEYDLLEKMLDDHTIVNFKTIQIQFHTEIENCENRRTHIRKQLENFGYKNIFNYPFVWEAWSLQ